MIVERSPASFAVNRARINLLAAGRTLPDEGSAAHFGSRSLRRLFFKNVFQSGLARSVRQPRAARFAKDPRGLNAYRASGASLQFAGHTAALNQGLAAPFAIAQPFREIYVASVAVHHRIECQAHSARGEKGKNKKKKSE